MEIVLKQKDADFILNYLRSDLERLNTNYDEVNKNEKKIKDLNAKIDKECGFFEKLLLKAYNKETQEQLDFLSKIGCREIQGYYFAKPMDKDTFMGLVQRSQDI